MMEYIYKIKGDSVDVLKKGTRMVSLQIDRTIVIKDVLNLTSPVKLSKFLKMWQAPEEKVTLNRSDCIFTLTFSPCFHTHTSNQSTKCATL